MNALVEIILLVFGTITFFGVMIGLAMVMR
jgi:hypothetical protein